MRILVNATTLVVGGGVQVALNFIKYTKGLKYYEFYYLLSSEVYDQCKSYVDLGSDFTVLTFSPARLRHRKKMRAIIKCKESEFNPDMVYSIGAPSYIDFERPEVLRLTNGWLYGDTKLAYTTYDLFERWKAKLTVMYQRSYIKSDNFIITQTEEAKRNISNKLKISAQNIEVIRNVHASFSNQSFKECISLQKDQLNILCLSAPYPHKNLSVIPAVIHHLSEICNFDFKFTVTIPEGYENKELERYFELCEFYGVKNKIVNKGKVNFVDIPNLYLSSDILFLPTLLETFSVTYLEAMHFGLPIVTTDLPFAHEICKESALYFEPKNAVSAAEKIKELVINSNLRNKLLIKSKAILNEYSSQENIYAKHLEVIEKFYRRVGQ